MEYKGVSGIVFDPDQEYVLVGIEDEKYAPICDKTTIIHKYHPLINIIKLFKLTFDKFITCWDHVVSYNNIEYFTVVTDLSDMECGENYDTIHISDLNNVDCTSELKWLIYLSLDIHARNLKISKN